MGDMGGRTGQPLRVLGSTSPALSDPSGRPGFPASPIKGKSERHHLLEAQELPVVFYFLGKREKQGLLLSRRKFIQQTDHGLSVSHSQPAGRPAHAQPCLTLCDPMDCWPARLLCPEDFPGKNIAVGCHFLLQGIFPTQDRNCISCVSCTGRWILYQSCLLGSPVSHKKTHYLWPCCVSCSILAS